MEQNPQSQLPNHLNRPRRFAVLACPEIVEGRLSKGSGARNPTKTKKRTLQNSIYVHTVQHVRVSPRLSVPVRASPCKILHPIKSTHAKRASPHPVPPHTSPTTDPRRGDPTWSPKNHQYHPPAASQFIAITPPKNFDILPFNSLLPPISPRTEVRRVPAPSTSVKNRQFRQF